MKAFVEGLANVRSGPWSAGNSRSPRQQRPTAIMETSSFGKIVLLP